MRGIFSDWLNLKIDYGPNETRRPGANDARRMKL